MEKTQATSRKEKRARKYPIYSLRKPRGWRSMGESIGKEERGWRSRGELRS